MAPDVTLYKQYDNGASIYKFRGSFVFVPATVTEHVGTDVDSDEEAVRAADALHRDTPIGVVTFEENGRSAARKAELWAAVQNRIELTPPLEWRELLTEDCRRARIPAVVAGAGKATTAAFLASYGFENKEIANTLGVSQRTVSQYISDFLKGER